MKNMPDTFNINIVCSIPLNNIGQHAQVKHFPNRSVKHAHLTTD